MSDTTLQTRFPKFKGRLSFWPEMLLLIAGILLFFWLSHLFLQLDTFPDKWNVGLQEAMNNFKRWVVVNRNSHWMFAFFFEPLSAVIDFCLRRVEDFLLWLPWPVTILTFFFLGERLGGLRLGLLAVFCLFPMGLFGLWD